MRITLGFSALLLATSALAAPSTRALAAPSTSALAAPSTSVLVAPSPVASQPLKSGIDLAGIATDIRPGDDFDGFANGGWRARTEIPADRASTGVGYDVFQVAEQRTAALIGNAAAGHPAAGTTARRIADYYTAYTDTAAIEARGLAPIKAELAQVAALADKAALATLLGANLRADTDPLNNTNLWTQNLFGLFVTQGLETPGRTLPYLMQGGLGMPDRDYYLADSPEMAALRNAYQAHIAKMLTPEGTRQGTTIADCHRRPCPGAVPCPDGAQPRWLVHGIRCETRRKTLSAAGKAGEGLVAEIRNAASRVAA